MILSYLVCSHAVPVCSHIILSCAAQTAGWNRTASRFQTPTIRLLCSALAKGQGFQIWLEACKERTAQTARADSPQPCMPMFTDCMWLYRALAKGVRISLGSSFRHSKAKQSREQPKLCGSRAGPGPRQWASVQAPACGNDTDYIAPNAGFLRLYVAEQGLGQGGGLQLRLRLQTHPREPLQQRPC